MSKRACDISLLLDFSFFPCASFLFSTSHGGAGSRRHATDRPITPCHCLLLMWCRMPAAYLAVCSLPVSSFFSSLCVSSAPSQQSVESGLSLSIQAFVHPSLLLCPSFFTFHTSVRRLVFPFLSPFLFCTHSLFVCPSACLSVQARRFKLWLSAAITSRTGPFLSSLPRHCDSTGKGLTVCLSLLFSRLFLLYRYPNLTALFFSSVTLSSLRFNWESKIEVLYRMDEQCDALLPSHLPFSPRVFSLSSAHLPPSSSSSSPSSSSSSSSCCCCCDCASFCVSLLFLSVRF